MSWTIRGLLYDSAIHTSYYAGYRYRRGLPIRGNTMTNQELIHTLRKASESQDNLALQMLLIYAAERIERLARSLGEKIDEAERI